MTILRTALLVSITLLLATGCANQLGSPEREQGHDSFEMTASSEELLEGWTREGEWLVSPVLDVPDGANRAGALVGLTSPGEMPAMEARVLSAGEPAGEWTTLGATWSEEDQHVAVAELGAIGDGAQLRIRAGAVEILQLLRWTATIPDEAVEAPEEEELGTSREALRTELRGLGIVTRESWGARATRCTDGDSRKTRFAVHHTVTSSTDPARQMRGIQRFHQDTRGWCDVGYHFLVGQDGRIYEGRPLHLLGAHVGGHNTGNIGISFIGCFHTSGCGGLGASRPTDGSIEIAGRLVGTLSRLYGITVDSARVRGHRDHSGQSTTCPGDHLRGRLSEIVSVGRTQTLSGSTPAPTPTPTPTPGASCRHTFGGNYANHACSASYQCCDGTWRTRGACGGCTCVEASGETGCSGGPPPGASCTHSFGGRYANTACSASYQCCDGTWRARSSGGCGTCFCTEASGSTGCGT
ncbi:peptidoglycan recognition protein [Sandaracinus amylolyticus]|uniref:peptidoglycan recognition protein family protein n=1 Tax=Sandaracinus amylolyticus TaxID=927083 RepID=UPI001F47ED97|nr:peptidoglycan recognition protein [Sandaracinus amylolyticus]UJR83973.1 Hypothetical protein I5071_60440 [Sandaracinus amylolyticus]